MAEKKNQDIATLYALYELHEQSNRESGKRAENEGKRVSEMYIQIF